MRGRLTLQPVVEVVVGGVISSVFVDVLHPVARVDLAKLSRFSLWRNKETAEDRQSDEKCFHVLAVVPTEPREIPFRIPS